MAWEKFSIYFLWSILCSTCTDKLYAMNTLVTSKNFLKANILYTVLLHVTRLDPLASFCNLEVLGKFNQIPSISPNLSLFSELYGKALLFLHVVCQSYSSACLSTVYLFLSQCSYLVLVVSSVL